MFVFLKKLYSKLERLLLKLFMIEPMLKRKHKGDTSLGTTTTKSMLEIGEQHEE